MKKYIYLMAFCLLAVFSQVLVSCSDDGVDEKSNANGYKVDLPSGTSGVEIEPLSDEEVNKLKAQGYKIVGTPVNVTQDGKDHVELKEMATVSFKIPEDFPKEQYNELVAVLITDEGPEYIIPDLEALSEGYVTFKTIHFCKTFTVQDKERLNDLFAEYVAIHGWDNDLRESNFNKLGDKLKEIADEAGLGENDLLGITMREVMGSNDYVNMTMEYINHYDKGDLKDNVISDISEKLGNDLKAKALSVLFTKLKKEPNNKAVKECLEKYLTQENMEKAGTLLGSENPTDVALQFAEDFAVDKLKGFTTGMVPYIKIVQAEAKAIDIFHKFWARNDMIYYYNEFEKLQKESDNPDFNWDQLEWRIGTPKFEFGMTLEEMKEMFKNRYYDRKKINAKKAEVLKLIDLWDEEGLLSNIDKRVEDTDIGHARIIKEFFTKTIDGKVQDDYCMRLTRLHKLMERFRKELVVNGDLQKKGGRANSIDKELASIVYQYITFYPDEKAFYKWLAKEGYINRKLEKNVDNMGEKRSWWLIETIIKKHENTTRDNGHYVDYMNYTATETEQTMTGMVTGMKSYYEYVQQPVSFVSTIQAPPAKIESGEKIVLHCTVKRTSPEAYCHVEVSPWMTWESEYSQTFASKTNVVGATGAGTRDIHATSGEFDFELSISSGSKNQKNKLILGAACESQIHWVYRWCSIFEKGEL
jgi:hypothetical protein